MRFLNLSFLTLLLTSAIYGQSNGEDFSHAVLRILNERRAARSLPPIPFSSKLTKVAEVHAQNQDAAKVPLTHDWHGEYACSMADSGVCMWDKPRRIAGYEDAGYECGYGGGTDDPKSLVDSWEGSPMHAQVLFN
ncbi:hypothetical protein K502DRAFT_357053, partial [Neoconidiobolus thromboides FSU 785]